MLVCYFVGFVTIGKFTIGCWVLPVCAVCVLSHIFMLVCSLVRSCVCSRKTSFNWKWSITLNFISLLSLNTHHCLCVLLWAVQTLPLAYTHRDTHTCRSEQFVISIRMVWHGMVCETAFCARRREWEWKSERESENELQKVHSKWQMKISAPTKPNTKIKLHVKLT